MCVLHVSLWTKVKPRTIGCVVMGMLLYSAGFGVNRVQIILSGFSGKLFCFFPAKTFCRYSCMYFLAALVRMCVYVMVMSSAWAMT